MESEAHNHFPQPALWIGPTSRTLDDTLAFTGSLFAFHWVNLATFLRVEELAELEFGYPIIVEFAQDGRSKESTTANDRLVRRILDNTKMPVIICMGHEIPAELVVDWMRAGVFSYVERLADALHFQLAFHDLAQRSQQIFRQHTRYDCLLKLWRSLSDREASVLMLIMEGVPNKTIAGRLGVSQRTVESRRHSLYAKLEARSIAEVVRTIYELDSLERIFHRIDSLTPPVAMRGTRSSKSARPIPSFDPLAKLESSRLLGHDSQHKPDDRPS